MKSMPRNAAQGPDQAQGWERIGDENCLPHDDASFEIRAGGNCRNRSVILRSSASRADARPGTAELKTMFKKRSVS
jgi:hypothetical protein